MKDLAEQNFSKMRSENSTGHNKEKTNWKKNNCWENKKDSAPHTLIFLSINHFTE
jgi:hypothetical protein